MIRGQTIRAAYLDEVAFPKIANGDMLQYFKDNPKKLKEKLDRDKAKKASMIKTSEHSLIAEKNPTEAEIKAGNYKKGHIKYNGMDITIENPAGSTRSGVSGTGKKWTSHMYHHYGYIRRTLGKDGDHVDVFIKPNTTSTEKVYIINQVNPGNKHFDEHKCMLGFDSQKEAKEAYLKNYEKGWKGVGSITPMTIDNFKTWVYKGKKMKPAEKAMDEEAYLRDRYRYAAQDEMLKMAYSYNSAANYGGEGMSGLGEQMGRYDSGMTTGMSNTR